MRFTDFVGVLSWGFWSVRFSLLIIWWLRGVNYLSTFSGLTILFFYAVCISFVCPFWVLDSRDGFCIGLFYLFYFFALGATFSFIAMLAVQFYFPSWKQMLFFIKNWMNSALWSSERLQNYTVRPDYFLRITIINVNGYIIAL